MRVLAVGRAIVIAAFGLITITACDPGGEPSTAGTTGPAAVETDPASPPRSPERPPPPEGVSPSPAHSGDAAVPEPSTPVDQPQEATSPPALPAEPSAPEPPAPAPPAEIVPIGPGGATADAVAEAYRVGAERASATAVALLDLQSGTLYGAGDIDETYASASLVKVFIATRLLVEGEADDPAVRDLMWKMITESDDDAATQLYPRAGGEGLVPWINNHYGVSGLAPADRPGYWGLTRVSARGMVSFYAAVIDDPAVAPWLLDAMDQAQPYGSDGFYQHFGLPSAAASWRVKQGWMCCMENLTRMHSTGYVDGDRYAVALLAAGPPSMYGDSGAQTLTLMAQALLPGGTIPTDG